MSSIVLGPVLDALGLGQSHYLVQGRDYPEVMTRSWATPATQLRSRQPASTLNLRHDRGLVLGPIVWLERDQAERCWAVATSEHDVPDRRWYFSAETDSTRSGEDVVITAVGLVERTAQTGLAPVTVLPGALADYRLRDARRGLDPVAEVVLDHAAHRAVGDPLYVHDQRQPAVVKRAGRGSVWLRDSHGDEQLVRLPSRPGLVGPPPGLR